MSDPEGKKDLFERFKTMSEDDLVGYQSAGKTVDRACSILGIILIFLILSFQTMFATVAFSFLVFILAQLSSAAAETVKHVEKSLERFDR